MALRILYIFLIASIGLCSGQTKDTLVSQKTKVVDSLIDGNQNLSKIIKAQIDSVSALSFLDNDHAASIDEKWLEELYGNDLYDSISKSISELTFEEVDYPELSTETLKARLKVLNTKTPFNVEYNPGLESVIKSYLKNRRESLQRLIGLSAYYFPMFEQELDSHDIPLEIKYS
mgnify:FL=1